MRWPLRFSSRRSPGPKRLPAGGTSLPSGLSGPDAAPVPAAPTLSFDDIWSRVQPYTMTSPERGRALWTAVNTVLDNGIPGCFVECGVWRGGSALLMVLTLLSRGVRNREIFLFDTFAGMTPPGPLDRDHHGAEADALMAGAQGPEIAALVKAACPLDEVRALLEASGYDMRLVHFVEGDVGETLPRTQTLRIALLRLDTDFYDSTLAELHHLYPRLVRGGVLIIDDYGHWQGARQAVEDYFADPAVPFRHPMLWAIDYTGRGGVKIEDDERIEIPRYDYIPPGTAAPDLLALFPDAVPENPWAVTWPYLRKEVPHIWRSDRRNDTPYVTGNASVEEAVMLHALAAPFRGRRGLEIGSHYGWTAAHLLAAGLELDCIDPEFSREVRRQAVAQALDAVPGGGRYRLWGGLSPQILQEVRSSRPEPWSFAFIDGNHDGDAPAADARGVIPHLAEDAVVVFHDLMSPHVERGLAACAEAGFNVRLINTMQILGVAWRGHVRLPDHVSDANVPAIWASHLAEYL